MTAVPAVPSTFVVGKARASDLELMRLALQFAMNQPFAQLRTDTQQTLTTANAATCLWTLEDSDVYGMHSTSSNTGRVTAVYPGWYTVSGEVTFQAHNTGRRRIYFQVNGVPVPGSGVYIPGFVSPAAEQLSVPHQGVLVYLNAGDYVEMVAWQNSTANLLIHVTSTTTDGNSIMTVRRVSD